jgi:penicillin-binding protein 1A
MVTRVTNYDGRLIDDFAPEVTDAIPAPTARIMVSMLREVFNSGTAELGKPLAAQYPVAGKTGTTNEFTDAWFLGFSPSLTCGVYVGFDDHRTLGDKEEGSRVALPIWLDFMGEVLKDRPVEGFPHSPLLTSPVQVKEILASAAPERLLAPGSTAPASALVNPPVPQTSRPGETRGIPKEAPANPKPGANSPPPNVPSGPVAKGPGPSSGKP